ncbi:MAG TPA: aminoglycoside phosphotransferase family protein [Micromonospora sp.]|nr:aminoglycoside phosphotransferase family protein [Micromonospora sp.]
MFVEARTRPILAKVCQHLGLPADRATLIRHHTNAVYAVGDAVIKIAPPDIAADDVRPSIALVRWLTSQGFPTAPLYDIDQPLEIDGHTITVWRRLNPAIENPVTAGELGHLLRLLHALPTPPIALKPLEPISRIRRSIKTSAILTDDDRDFLHTRLDQLAKIWADMPFTLSPGLIHADPQTHNALCASEGCAVLTDWDTAAIGPREWDVATIAVHCRRFTPTDPDAFVSFITAYGWDPAAWHHFENLCRLRELKMIVTNARKSRPGSSAANEVHRRLAALRADPHDALPWHLL